MEPSVRAVIQPASTVMTFKEVKELADSQKGLELPGFSPYSAVQALISRNSRGWAGACLTKVFEVMLSGLALTLLCRPSSA